MPEPMMAMVGWDGGWPAGLVVAAVILFGAKKIAEFAEGLGQGIGELKRALGKAPR